MEDKFSTSIIFITITFIAAFALSVARSEFLLGVISLVFALLIYSIGFILARHTDSKDLARQFEN